MLSLYDQMEINKSSFTDNDTIIYNAILEYPGIIERYTVSQLSDFLKVSTASVMRFAKKLGYSGYSELRFEYMKAAHASNQNESADNGSALAQYVKLMTESFSLFNNLDEQDFISLAEEIKKHKRVCAIGSGKSGLVAEYMRYSFVRLGKPIDVATESVLIHDLPKVSTADDLYIYFSEKANSMSSMVKEFVKNTKDSSDACVIIVTCNPKSAFESQVDKVIVIPNVNNQQEGIRAHSLMLGFIDILVSYYINNL